MTDRIPTEEAERIARRVAGFDWETPTQEEAKTAAAIRSLAAERDELRVGMELAWGIIANAHEGGWENAPSEWREAAERWRDDHWHTSLDRAALGEEAE